MKKTSKALAVLLAATMTVGMSFSAFAASTYPTDASSAAESSTFTFDKVYYKTGTTTNSSVVPSETLNFTVAPASTNPEVEGQADPSIEETEITGNDQEIKITIPSYTVVGKYNYTVTETEGSTQGVTYATTGFGIQVMVSNGENGLEKTVTFTDGTTGAKIDKIVNYYDVSNGGDDKTRGLEITKNVTGALGSKTQAFTMTVTFSSVNDVKSDINYFDGTNSGTINKNWTKNETTGKYEASVTIYLKDSETNSNMKAWFDYIPVGVTYEVVEDSSYTEEDSTGNDPAKGYDKPDYGINNGEGTAKADETDTMRVTNNKGGTLDTGVVLDNAPYILLAAVAVCGLALFMTKKRHMEE